MAVYDLWSPIGNAHRQTASEHKRSELLELGYTERSDRPKQPKQKPMKDEKRSDKA